MQAAQGGAAGDPLPAVGDRVLVFSRYDGIVRFVGPLGTDDGSARVGVQLSKPVGRHNGTVDGVAYFSCPEPHGVLVRPSVVRPYDPQFAAAVAIQDTWRHRSAVKRVNSMQAARTWNVLDNHFEEESMRRGKSFERATKQLKATTVVRESMVDTQERHNAFEEQLAKSEPMEGVSDSASREDADYESEDSLDDDLFTGATVEELQQAAADASLELEPEMLLAINPSDDYEGVHLRFPLRLENVIEMLESFKVGKILHLKYFMLLLLHGRTLFSQEENVQCITIEEGCKLTVVGDTHGQLQDLFTIFTVNKRPSERNWYLFNGDFVDRGTKGCEVVATMLAFKILYPKSVFLNRGNHEARAQNAWMGFEEELLTKYGHDSVTVAMKPSSRVPSRVRGARPPDRATGMKQRMNVFGPGDRLASLKLYMLCQSTFDALPLSALIQERIFVCHGGLFRNENVRLDHIRMINRKREPPLEGTTPEDRIYEDILWSDPRPTATYPRPLRFKRQSDRGAGCEFGQLVTDRFCAINQIALIVRSHECVAEGYEVLHNGRLITVFSASRYCGTQTNKGAYLRFGPDLQPEIRQFYAHPITRGTFITDDEREAMLVRDAIKMIIENICDKRLDLYWYFTQHDENHTGRVTRVEWARGLSSVFGLDLPFLHFQPELAEVEVDGLINYTKFLSRFQIVTRKEDSGWQDAIIRRICEKLFSQVGADLESAYQKFDTNDDGQIEFQEFVRTLHALNVGLTDQQMYELMRSVDVDDDAHINFKEFAERFGLVFSQVSSANQVTNNDATGASAVATPPPAPRVSRTDSMRELEESTRREMPNKPISPRSASKMKLDWSAMDSWTISHINAVGRAIFKKTDTLRDAWTGFDTANKGYIEPADFSAAVKNYLGLDHSEQDALKIFKAIDTNDSKRINVLEFFDAFRADDRNPRAQTWKEGVVQQISNCLYQHRIHLRAAFRMFDVDGNGVITAEEFSHGMNSINELLDKPLTSQQIDELRRALDRNGDGKIDYREFFESFSIEDTSMQKTLFRSGSSYMDLNEHIYENEPKKREAIERIRQQGARDLAEGEQDSSMDVDA